MLPLLVLAVISVVLAGLWYAVYYEEGLRAQRIKEERLAAGFADFALALHRTISDVTFLIDHDASERTGGATVRIDGFDEERMARETAGGILIYNEGSSAAEGIARLLTRRGRGDPSSLVRISPDTRPTSATGVRVVAWVEVADTACASLTPPPAAGECRVRVEFGGANTEYQVSTRTRYVEVDTNGDGTPDRTDAYDEVTLIATVRVPISGSGALPGHSSSDPLAAGDVVETLFFVRTEADPHPAEPPPYTRSDGSPYAPPTGPRDGDLTTDPVYAAVINRATPATPGVVGAPDPEARPGFASTTPPPPHHAAAVDVSAPADDGGDTFQEITLRRTLPEFVTEGVVPPPDVFSTDDGGPRVPGTSRRGAHGTGRGSDHCRAQAAGVSPANHFLAMFCTMFGNQDGQYGTGGAALDTEVTSATIPHPDTGLPVEFDPGGRALDLVLDEAYERYMPGLLAARERLSASVQVRAWLGCRDDGVIRRIEAVIEPLRAQAGVVPGIDSREGCSFEGGRDPEGNDRSMLLVIWLQEAGGEGVSFSQGAVAAALTEYFPDVAPNFVGFGSLAGSEVEYRPGGTAVLYPADPTADPTDPASADRTLGDLRDDDDAVARRAFSCGFADYEIGYEALPGCENAPSVVGTGQRIGDFRLPEHGLLGTNLGNLGSDQSDRTTETYAGIDFDRDEFRYPTRVAFYAVMPVLAPPLPLAGVRPGPIDTYRSLGVSPGNGLSRGSVTRFSGFNGDPHSNLQSRRDACDKTAPRSDATRRMQVFNPMTSALEDRVEAFGGGNLIHANEPHPGSARFHLDEITRLTFVDRYLTDASDPTSLVTEQRFTNIDIGPRAARPRFVANRGLRPNRLPAPADFSGTSVEIDLDTDFSEVRTAPPADPTATLPADRATRTDRDRSSSSRLGPVRVDALGYFCLVGSSGIAHGDANAIPGGGFRSQ